MAKTLSVAAKMIMILAVLISLMMFVKKTILIVVLLNIQYGVNIPELVKNVVDFHMKNIVLLQEYANSVTAVRMDIDHAVAIHMTLQVIQHAIQRMVKNVVKNHTIGVKALANVLNLSGFAVDMDILMLTFGYLTISAMVIVAQNILMARKL